MNTPYEAEKQTLECTSCRGVLTADQILSAATACSTPLRILYFHCSNCRTKLEAQVQPGKLSIGAIDGFPGPCFISTSSETVPGLTVEATETGLLCVHAGRQYNVGQYRPANEKATADQEAEAMANVSLVSLVFNHLAEKFFGKAQK